MQMTRGVGDGRSRGMVMQVIRAVGELIKGVGD